MAQRSGHMLDGLDAKASNCVNASTTYIRATIVLIPAIVVDPGPEDEGAVGVIVERGVVSEGEADALTQAHLQD